MNPIARGAPFPIVKPEMTKPSAPSAKRTNPLFEKLFSHLKSGKELEACLDQIAGLKQVPVDCGRDG